MMRLVRDTRSVLIGGISAFSTRLTDAQLASYAELMARRSSEAEQETFQIAPALTLSDFSDRSTEPLYKYVSDDTWQRYISKGSIQLGTASYYRTTPNMNIRDRREGASTFHLLADDFTFNVDMMIGDNCAVFCGTAQMEGPDHELMRSRFGERRIKIDPLPDFIAFISERTKAFRTRVFDVRYTDLKHFVAEDLEITRYFQTVGKGDLDAAALRKLNENYFDIFHDYAFLPSLFSKPLAYADERERRIVFELTDDISAPININDEALLKFITPVGT
ncbi:hypothetical protein [Bradyrhizobium centrosematis]|uniref:hypothetical protein n=1 Tax=Bradyrhizobium centrosematis TaxID=1300039 RepID=UPI00388D8459